MLQVLDLVIMCTVHIICIYFIVQVYLNMFALMAPGARTLYMCSQSTHCFRHVVCACVPSCQHIRHVTAALNSVLDIVFSKRMFVNGKLPMHVSSVVKCSFLFHSGRMSQTCCTCSACNKCVFSS